MEAATAASSLSARLRASRFERECERLRPLGEAYVLRRFGGSLNRADAEDAVAEVLVRLHRMADVGRPPQNLRATFFASVRNQAIDQLRWCAVRPTVELEAAGEAPAPGPPPSEWAEGREDAARLQEALGRMRPNYREAILLRFGLGMTVPEIAEQCSISLPAAKKLVLRATAQARKRLEGIEGADFCPEMRGLAERSVLDRHVCGLAGEEEMALLRAHLSHCGACKSFLASLHERLHDLGAAAVFGIAGAERLDVHLVALDRLGDWSGAALEGAQAGAGRLRQLAFKASGAFSGSDAGATGALLTTGQKVAAVCTAGAASAATCLLSGAVGPGIAPPAATAEPHQRPAAQVRSAEPPAQPAPQAPAPPLEAEPEPAPPPAPAPEPEPEPSQVVQAPASPAPAESAAASEPSEFGLESVGTPSAPPSAAPSPPAAARATGGSAGGGFAGEGAPASGGGAAPAGSGVGFQG